MKTHHRFYTLGVLLLISGTVHAQVTETMPGHFIDLDTVVISPALQWVVDSICIAAEIKEHQEMLLMYRKMPDRYFAALSKRVQADHIITREELIAHEEKVIALAKNKFPVYRKVYENTLTANK